MADDIQSFGDDVASGAASSIIADAARNQVKKDLEKNPVGAIFGVVGGAAIGGYALILGASAAPAALAAAGAYAFFRMFREDTPKEKK